MSGPASMQTHAEAQPGLRDWAKTVLIILAAGPPVGGVPFAIIAMISKDSSEWIMLPVAILGAIVTSYVIGLPIAIIALILFLLLQHFIARGTVYLAIACGLVSSEILTLLYHARLPSFAFNWGDYIVALIMLGIPSAISAYVCWRITKPLHRLQ